MTEWEKRNGEIILPMIAAATVVILLFAGFVLREQGLLKFLIWAHGNGTCGCS